MKNSNDAVLFLALADDDDLYWEPKPEAKSPLPKCE